MPQQLPQTLKNLFDQINHHILVNPHRSKMISLSEFWSSDRLCVTLDQFEQMLISIDYYIKSKERNELIDSGVQLITLENVLEGVEQWKWAEKDVTTYISNKMGESKSLNQSQSGQKGAQSASNQKWYTSSSLYRTNKNHYHLTKSYINEHHKREHKNKMKLLNTLQTVKNQSDYEITVKVGEVNDICKKMKNGMSYVLDTGVTSDSNFSQDALSRKANTEEITIIECSKGGKEQSIPFKQFQRKYRVYKQAFMNITEQFEGSIQQDLKQVLVEVMCLNSQMQQQVSLLQSKGVTS